MEQQTYLSPVGWLSTNFVFDLNVRRIRWFEIANADILFLFIIAHFIVSNKILRVYKKNVRERRTKYDLPGYLKHQRTLWGFFY